jgi:hypothetical protein
MRSVAMALFGALVVACGSADSAPSGSGAGGGGGGGGGNSGGSAGTPPDNGEFPSCVMDRGTLLRLRGSLAGQAVDVRQAPSSGGYVNGTQGQFESPPMSFGGSDPGTTYVKLNWTMGVDYGHTAPATGVLRIGAAGPLAGVTLCAGDGSQIGFPRGSIGDNLDFQFRIGAITKAPECTEPVDGDLTGCWNSNF